ncbi:MAG: AMP-binding protein [Paludibacteraceae bacterium]|nr:AMP-binding protein [Paludibacteraceae bacterium]
MVDNFVRMFEDSFRHNWNEPCFTDYETNKTLTYGQVAEQVEKLHIVFQKCGLKKDDNIALIGRNSTNWAIAYIATITYGAVIVPILHDFHAKDVHHILRHSDSKFLFSSEVIWDHLDENEIGEVRVVLSLTDFSPLLVRMPKSALSDASDIAQSLEGVEQQPAEEKACDFAGLSLDDLSHDAVQKAFDEKFGGVFHKDLIRYNYKDNEELASINYTSGTTGYSKGVMTAGRALASNAKFGLDEGLIKTGSRFVAFLPLAHAYGCAWDFLGSVCGGGHTWFITKVPTPKVLMKAFAEVKPNNILSVPLIIEKIYKKQILPIISKPSMNWVLSVRYLDELVLKQIRKQLVAAFGGEFEQIIIGGAAINAEVEAFFEKLKFPFTIGYGMTETAPLVSYAHWTKFVPQSCGRILKCMEARIANPNKEGVGEIEIKGDHVMLGYYKNEEATRASFTEDGWLKTGDLGFLDADQNLFIKGRSKTMLLGPSGQNIYPEAIEDKLNNMPYVLESIVVQRDGKLVALVYPDMDAVDAAGFTQADLPQELDHVRKEVNQQLASFEQISKIVVQTQEFQKTPKNSIKRYLYS